MTTPTSGTAATSSPVSELDNRCSAVPSAIQGVAISTPAKAASGSSRLRSGASSPRLAASGRRSSAASTVRQSTSIDGLTSRTATRIIR
jgi:hypothetical protein